MNTYERRPFGKTGLDVCRLGVSASYGAPAQAFEEAFERGVNYFYWGSVRKEAMARGIRNIIAKGKRDEMILLLQSYSRSAALLEKFFLKGLNTLGIDRADVLLLGWYNSPPSPRIMERVVAMRDRGLFRYLAISGHNRLLFPELSKDGAIDIFHVRYSAVHRGAEQEVFAKISESNRPGIVTYTATRWGDLLNPGKMPPGESPPRGADCYRFVLTNPAVDVCMTGPGSVNEMREALAALELGPMSDEEMSCMRRLGDYIHAKYKRPFAG